jgi:hypothetical protein
MLSRLLGGVKHFLQGFHEFHGSALWVLRLGKGDLITFRNRRTSSVIDEKSQIE